MPESLNERWAEVQSELCSEIEMAPISGNVSPNILVRTEFLENPIKTSSVLFQNMSENSLESNVEMVPDIELARMETVNSIIPDTSFSVQFRII